MFYIILPAGAKAPTTVSNTSSVKQKAIKTTQNAEGIYTDMFSVFTRYRDVKTTVTWDDGFTTELEWKVVANVFVKYTTVNGIYVASWYVPFLEVHKKYDLEEGGSWSGYHIDDWFLGGSIWWTPDLGYDRLQFDQSLIHYLPREGIYEDKGSSSWTISVAAVVRLLAVSISWTPSESGKEEVKVDTYSTSFDAYYIDKHDGAHPAYVYSGKFAYWAVALTPHLDKNEKGEIYISRPYISVVYHRWNYGGLSDHIDYKDLSIPINANDVEFHYDNYRDGYNAAYHYADTGEWS